MNGVQSRQIYCVPSAQNITDQLWAHLVDPKKCRTDEEGNTQVNENKFLCEIFIAVYILPQIYYLKLFDYISEKATISS